MPAKVIVIARVFLSAAILAGVASAQSPTTSQTTNPASKTSLQIATGGALVSELAKPVDAKRAKTGDRIEALLTMDTLLHGEILVPRGAKIIGHIIDARARTKKDPESMLEFAFDRIVLKGEREIPLKARIQAIGAPMQAFAPGNEDISDLDLASQTQSRSAVGPNEKKSILGTTYPGSRRPANAGASEQPADSGGLQGNLTRSLGPASQGVVGMKGIVLSNTAQGSVVSSAKEGTVRLSGRTQLVLHIIELQLPADSLRKTRN